MKNTQTVKIIDGLKRFKKELDEGLKQAKNKQNFLSSKLRQFNKRIQDLSTTSLENKWCHGIVCQELKEWCKKNSKLFEEVFEKVIVAFTLRTGQRYMKLVKIVDLDRYPTLVITGYTDILSISRLLQKGQTVAGFLLENNIELDFDYTKDEEINKFRSKVNALLTAKKKKNPDKKNPNDNLTPAIFAESFKQVSVSMIEWCDKAIEDESLIQGIDKEDYDLLKNELEPKLKKLIEMIGK